MKLPLMLKLKLLRTYGIRDYSAARKIYNEVFGFYYKLWEEEDWKDWLDTFRFNSSSSKHVAWIARNTYLTYRDTSWKSCKHHMTKSCWRARMLKSTPNERPSCMSFKNSTQYQRLQNPILPDDYLNAICNRTATTNVYEWPFTSVYELVIWFDTEYDGIMTSPEYFAVNIFTVYMMSIAHEWQYLNNDVRSFYGSKKIPASGFTILLNALKMTSVFDSLLQDERVYSALRVLCKWYSMPHTVSGVYHVLTEHNGSYKKYVAYNEILHALADVLECKRQLCMRQMKKA